MGTPCYNIWSRLYMPSHFLRSSLDFKLILMFRFHGSADVHGWWGKWVHMQLVGEEMNAYRHSLHCLVKYETKGNCPSFCCKDFCVIFVNSSFMLLSVFNSTVQNVSCQSNNRFIRQVVHTLESRSGIQKVLGLLCAEFCWSAFSSTATKRKHTDQDIIELIPESDSWHTFIWRWRHFFSEWHKQHYWHKLHTVKWQYKLLTFGTCSPPFYRGSQ